MAAMSDESGDRVDERINGIDKRTAVMERHLLDVRENQARFHADLRDLRASLNSKVIWLATILIAVETAVLLVAMAKGFHWLQ